MIKRLIFTALDLIAFRKPQFACPICSYRGPFKGLDAPTGYRLHAKCPSCGSLERHRLQWCVLSKTLAEKKPPSMRLLHFAPEAALQKHFSIMFGTYETADLTMPGVDHRIDIQSIPLPDASCDMVFASHVLEHIPQDVQAIREIRRILKPNGIAILPVPIVSAATREYNAPNPAESFHVRAPGLDYFDRFRLHFDRVAVFSSLDVPAEHQPFTLTANAAGAPEATVVKRQGALTQTIDYVPVCYVTGPAGG